MDLLLIVLAAAWLLVVGAAAVRAALAAARLARTAESGGAARLEALVAFDRRREHLTERQAAAVRSALTLRGTATGARRGLRVLAILRDALREAVPRL